ncbi:hypothetical protein PKF032_03300 [Polynucleobacter yangtzensis]|uniref:Methyltransferase type 11 domain-containing protein n=1 Tax=Polynucleobacter yangtzensis TaxID=1743159 RepID=A0ABM8CKS6_9BURK|nr:hypothetical protein PKF032_03300 [Polynucleobacter yangtzensis]
MLANKKGKILDVGAGGGPYAELCKEQGYNYTSQDFCQLDVDLLREGSYHPIDIVCDATTIPVDGFEYDYVLCTEVLEHTVDPALVVKEIARVLKIGGKIFLTVPQLAPGHQRPYWFYGGLTEEWIIRIFRDCGLEIESIGYPYRGPANLAKLCIANLSSNIKNLQKLNGLSVRLLLALPLNLLISISALVSAMLTDSLDSENNLGYGNFVIAIKR